MTSATPDTSDSNASSRSSEVSSQANRSTAKKPSPIEQLRGAIASGQPKVLRRNEDGWMLEIEQLRCLQYNLFRPVRLQLLGVGPIRRFLRREASLGRLLEQAEGHFRQTQDSEDEEKTFEVFDGEWIESTSGAATVIDLERIGALEAELEQLRSSLARAQAAESNGTPHRSSGNGAPRRDGSASGQPGPAGRARQAGQETDKEEPQSDPMMDEEVSFDRPPLTGVGSSPGRMQAQGLDSPGDASRDDASPHPSRPPESHAEDHDLSAEEAQANPGELSPDDEAETGGDAGKNDSGEKAETTDAATASEAGVEEPAESAGEAEAMGGDAPEDSDEGALPERALKGPDTSAFVVAIETLLGQPMKLERITKPDLTELGSLDAATFYASALIDDGDMIIGVMLANRQATVDLGGGLLMLPESEMKRAIEDGDVSSDTTDAMTEVFNTLSSTVNGVSGNPHVRVQPLATFKAGDFPWLDAARTQWEVISGEGRIIIAGR